MEHPSGGMLANFVNCAPPTFKKSRGVKMLGNTEWAREHNETHHRFNNVKGAPPIVRGDGALVDRRTDTDKYHSVVHSHYPLVLYHYITKSVADTKKKLKMGGGDGTCKSWIYVARTEAASYLYCPLMLGYVRACCMSSLGEVAVESSIKASLKRVADRAPPLNETLIASLLAPEKDGSDGCKVARMNG